MNCNHRCALCGPGIIAQLRADLATAQKEAKRCAEGWDTAALRLSTVTAERTEHHRAELHWMSLRAQESADLAETRKALERIEDAGIAEANRLRAELAKAEARVNVAKAIASNAFAKALALDAEEMLEALGD